MLACAECLQFNCIGLIEVICFGYRVVVFHERMRGKTNCVLQNFTRDTAKVKSMIDTIECVVVVVARYNIRCWLRC